MLSPSRPTLNRLLLLAVLLATILPAQALLNIDGTRNQLFVFGGLTFTHSDNLFAEPVGRADYTVTAQLGAELQRRAGIVSVTAIAKVDFVSYGEFTAQNSTNPNLSVLFTKSSGRTTGSLSISAYRESRSDSAVNLLTNSWNYPIALNLRYPLNQKLYLTSATGYLRRSYQDNPILVSYTDYSEQVDMNYVYSSKLDLTAGYRIRVGKTIVEGRTFDHWFNVGATGNLFSKMSGTLRFGYQLRDFQQNSGQRYDQFNAQATVNWPITRKVNFGLRLNRDFNTIATGTSVDTTSLALQATYTYNSKIDFHANIGTGRNRFLDLASLDRRDNFFTWSAGGRYRLNEHFQAGASYVFLRNSSSRALSEFDSHGYSLDITSRF